MKWVLSILVVFLGFSCFAMALEIAQLRSRMAVAEKSGAILPTPRDAISTDAFAKRLDQLEQRLSIVEMAGPKTVLLGKD